VGTNHVAALAGRGRLRTPGRYPGGRDQRKGPGLAPPEDYPREPCDRTTIRNRAPDKVGGALRTRRRSVTERAPQPTKQGTKLQDNHRAYDRRKNLVLHASNYIVHLYPTTQKYPPVFIVITAYSDNVRNIRECLPQPSIFWQIPTQGILPCDLS